MSEELVAQKLLNCGPMMRISLQHFRDEAFGIIGHMNILRIRIVAVFDLGVGRLDVIGLEGRSSDNKSVSDDSQTPNIDLE